MQPGRSIEAAPRGAGCIQQVQPCVCHPVAERAECPLALMIALAVEMRNVFVQGSAKRCFAEQDQSGQALL